jgi:15-cis-phytoene synthase
MTASVLAGSRSVMARGSRSFYLASRLLPRSVRNSAQLLYTWCRHCDDTIDAQVLGQAPTPSPQDGRRALALLVEQSGRALGEGPLDSTPFEALRQVARAHGLPARYVREHLRGFAMDVEGAEYTVVEDTIVYAYRVAGVVGEMMAWLMGVRDRATLDRAADLGIAFQLTNVARDVLDDARIGRVYLPLAWLKEERLDRSDLTRAEARQPLTRVVTRLLDEADRYYRSAAEGIERLGSREAWSIESARRIYREIGTEVRRRGPHAWDRRIVIASPKKLALVMEAARAMRRRHRAQGPLGPRAGLWPIPSLD